MVFFLIFEQLIRVENLSLQLFALEYLHVVFLVHCCLLPSGKHHHVVELAVLRLVDALRLDVSQGLDQGLVLVLAALMHYLQLLHLLADGVVHALV